MIQIKIVVLGAGAVGKSAITIRMVVNEFREDYDPTIEDSYTLSVHSLIDHTPWITCVCHRINAIHSTTITVDGEEIDLDILDTAGQAQFNELQNHWIREADAFLLVYSVESSRTLKAAMELYRKIKREKTVSNGRIDLVLIGNKCDLPASAHEVSVSDGKELADRWEVPFFHTSAKTGVNVTEAFDEIVRESRREKMEEGDIEEIIIHKGRGGCCVLL